MNLPEQVKEAQTLSRWLNVKDLEARLTPRMKEEGFTQVSEEEIGKIPDELYQTTYSVLDLVNGRAIRNPPGFYQFTGFHDERDILLYLGDKSTILIGKKPVYAPDYWKRNWGIDMTVIYDLSGHLGMEGKQVTSLPPNESVLSGLTNDDPNISILNAFQLDQFHGTGILHIDPYFAFRQYMDFRKPNMEESRDQFINYVTNWIAKLARVNVGWLQNQLKVRSAMGDADYAFQLLIGQSIQ